MAGHLAFLPIQKAFEPIFESAEILHAHNVSCSWQFLQPEALNKTSSDLWFCRHKSWKAMRQLQKTHVGSCWILQSCVRGWVEFQRCLLVFGSDLESNQRLYHAAIVSRWDNVRHWSKFRSAFQICSGHKADDLVHERATHCCNKAIYSLSFCEKVGPYERWLVKLSARWLSWYWVC